MRNLKLLIFFFLGDVIRSKSGSVVGWNSRKKCLLLPSQTAMSEYFFFPFTWILMLILFLMEIDKKVSSFWRLQGFAFFHLITVNYDPLWRLFIRVGIMDWNFFFGMDCSSFLWQIKLNISLIFKIFNFL
jgi:hypothetical protein